MEKALPLCWKHKVKLITNMGSANPQAAAQKCVEIARRHGLTGMKIACVTGVFDELKFDLIGCNSLYWNPDFKYNEEPSEVRVRVSGRAKARADAELIGNEVEALYTNGPAGGCGAVKRTRDIVSVASILVSRCDVKPEVEIFEV